MAKPPIRSLVHGMATPAPPKTGYVPPAGANGAGGKIGYSGATPNRAIATNQQTPQSNQGRGENRTQITTYFTSALNGAASPILYSGDRMWAKVTLTLETAGPVAVGNMAELAPVLSGRGQLLETGVPTPFTIAKGTRLYIAATSVNRVKVVIEPLPWLEQITALISGVIASLGRR
jgi:hypothetical protein